MTFHTRKRTRVDTRRGSDLCEDTYRPNWSSTISSVLCSDHFDDSCFTNKRKIAVKLGMKRKLKPDAVPTIDFSLTETADNGDHSLTDRAERQVRLSYIFDLG